MRKNYNHLPIHDFENDNTISEKRKEACRLNYLDMQLHHLDKIYTSAYVFDKKTGEPVEKKPRSLHELVFLLMNSSLSMINEINEIKYEIHKLKNSESK